MAIEYEDVCASVFQAILDKQAVAQPLNGYNVFFPGEEYDTKGKTSWCVPFVGELVFDGARRPGGSGVLNILIWSRIGETNAAFLREKLAGACRRALENGIFAVKDHQTVSGLNTTGWIKFHEGQLLTSGLHGEGIYAATFNLPFRVEEE